MQDWVKTVFDGLTRNSHVSQMTGYDFIMPDTSRNQTISTISGKLGNMHISSAPNHLHG